MIHDEGSVHLGRGIYPGYLIWWSRVIERYYSRLLSRNKYGQWPSTQPSRPRGVLSDEWSPLGEDLVEVDLRPPLQVSKCQSKVLVRSRTLSRSALRIFWR